MNLKSTKIVGFDVRIPPKVDLVEFEDQIKSWCQQAGSDVSYNIFKVQMYSPYSL